LTQGKAQRIKIARAITPAVEADVTLLVFGGEG
jgi:hypothetical protein